ncbi:MAG: hypothetical protein ACREF5_01575 [Candidatus Saccharimonadales bacterium]
MPIYDIVHNMHPENYKLPQGPSHAPQNGESHGEALRRQQKDLWVLPEKNNAEQLQDSIRNLEIPGESENDRDKRVSRDLRWGRRLTRQSDRRSKTLATYVVDTVRGETPRLRNIALRRAELTSMGVPVGYHDDLVRTAREKDRPVKEVRRLESRFARWRYGQALNHLGRYLENEVTKPRS